MVWQVCGGCVTQGRDDVCGDQAQIAYRDRLRQKKPHVPLTQKLQKGDTAAAPNIEKRGPPDNTSNEIFEEVTRSEIASPAKHS